LRIPGQRTHIGRNEKCIKISAWKPQAKTPLRIRKEDSTKTDLRKISYKAVD
jgi:hypothetical protein